MLVKMRAMELQETETTALKLESKTNEKQHVKKKSRGQQKKMGG